MHRVWRSLTLASLLLATLATVAQGKDKKLIEMGWDEPDPAFMRRHLDQLEASPFDGCVFHLMYDRQGEPPASFTWQAWGTRTFTEAEVASGLADLRATPFRRFRSNLLRMNVTPGRLDWFDDHGAVMANAQLAASIARRGGAIGILFDTEPYEGRLFEYPAQRDTARRPFLEYAAQARRRGAELMRAFERGYPGLVVFLTVSATHPHVMWEGDRIRPEVANYGLLTPFVDGMFLAASDSARIVDGLEGAYPIKDSAQLDVYFAEQTTGILPWLTDSTRYRKVLSRSFGIWIDYDSDRREWNVRDVRKNYRSPDTLRAVVRHALELADDYVWVYTQKPRWWTEEGTRKDLPESYVQALRDARKGLAP
jgi:hypothetical protein